MENIEKLIAEIEKEKDFERVVELFATAASAVKAAMQSTEKQKGRITEIIRDMEGYIEKPVDKPSTKTEGKKGK